MQAIQYVKSIPRWLTTRLLGKRWPALYTGPTACIRLAEVPEPSLPGPRWVRIATRMSGICGSDLAAITAKGTPYFSPLTSAPFVLGHENVGVVAEIGSAVTRGRVGQRVAIQPSLCCAVREVPCCQACAAGHFGACEHVMQGTLSPGIQTGYCRDTGGGWSPRFVAHEEQVYPLPDTLPDETAVLLEPLACAIHALLRARPADGQTALVLGCGTIGLLTIAALRRLFPRVRIAAAARYPHQERLANSLGADLVWGPSANLYEETCRLTKARMLRPELGKPVVLGGMDLVFDCVGSSNTLDDALRLCRSQGAVVLVGMPGELNRIDGTPLWHKEIRVLGAYTYGMEEYQGERLSTFTLAERLLLAEPDRFATLVGARFRLSDYRTAIDTALHTGRSGVAKTVFVFEPIA
ncbi:MAG: alcohol dehydrogenase catalytic domain-containing protein [Armatimonadetes bacterium]|nr:alcohol dehydrogenase catalytic domain-containing protein [Armatimonadota bacterium]